METAEHKKNGRSHLAVQATESEMHVTGRCLTHPETMADVIAKGVRLEDFAERTPQIVMGTVWDLFEHSELTSYEVVKTELIQREQFEDIGSEAWDHLLAFGWGAEDMPYHLNRVKRAARLRRKDRAMRDGAAGIRQGTSIQDREEAADDATERLIRERADQGESVLRGEDLAEEMRRRLEAEEAEEIRIATGIYSFDRQFRGIPRSRVTVIGARTNHGKTLTADMIALACAKRFSRQSESKLVVKFDLENSALEAQPRLLAGLASAKEVMNGSNMGLTTRAIEDHLQNNRSLTDPEMQLASEGNDELKELPIVLDTEGQGSPTYIRARLLAESARAELGLVIVDYMELVEGEGRTKTEEVMNAMRELHFIARDLEVPLLLLSQTNRNQTSRDAGEPHLSDLSWGDALAKYAKMVIMPFYPYVHWQQTGQTGPEPAREDYNLWVRKNKGPQGLCSLRIDSEVPLLYDPQDPEYTNTNQPF